MKQKHLIISLIAALLIVILVIQNTDAVSLKLFFWTVNRPLILLIVIVALISALASWFLSLSTLSEKRGELAEARKRIKELEKELASRPAPSPASATAPPAGNAGQEEKPKY